MENNRLYLNLKNKLCEMIYRGIYKDGESIPPERALAEALGVSRVTVRKALQLLEEDGIISREQGRGTIVTLREKGYEGTMDIITLLAPAQKPFFSSFIDHFQKNAEENDSLVLFKQKPQNENLEDCLFRLFQKNIRNVVLWLEDMTIDSEYIRRLRGLGVNVVFFDICLQSPYADCVDLDNHHAIETLYIFLKEKGYERIGYIGWDNYSLSSVRERENTYSELVSRKPLIQTIPWQYKENLIENTRKLILEELKNNKLPEAVICSDGEIGIAVKKAFLSQGIDSIPIASVDDFPESKELGLSVYAQSFELLAQRVYQCLVEQNTQSKEWKASTYQIKGNLIER